MLPVLGAAVTITAAYLMTAVPASAQVRVGVGVRVGTRAPIARRSYYRPYYYDPFFYNWSWYPGYYGYLQYRYPPYYYGRRDDSGSLRLDVRPRETQVFIDGYYAGVVDDFDGAFQHLDVEPGEHQLTLYLAGYRLGQQRVYVQPNRTFRLRYTMVPLSPGEPEPTPPVPAAAPPSTRPAAPLPRGPRDTRPGDREPPSGSIGARESGYGTLALRVQPGDAEILIDGEKWESSGNDRLLVQLSAGVHHVEAKKDGYRIYVTDVTVRPGETATVNVALSQQP
jgi:hypothetical protein